MQSQSRRNFLKAFGAAGLTLTASAANANIITPSVTESERRLKMLNLHTGEKLSARYWADGDYLDKKLSAFNRLLRDHRSGEVASIDPALLDQIHTIKDRLGYQGTIEIISGYRSPASNAQLRKVSSGVATKSLHTQGRAIDLRMPGIPLERVRDEALKLQAGGVGYYPKSNFVHLDTGRPRFW